MQIKNEGTTCTKCNRYVWKKDVDADGRCCFCEEPKPIAEPKPKKKVKNDDKGTAD